MRHQNMIIAMLTGIIAVSCTGCAGQQAQPKGEAVTLENGTVLHLTDQADEPEMYALAPTGSGIFFKGTDGGERGSGGWYRPLKYYDNESGETVYLCARPNCLHNGDEFCPATTPNYFVNSEPVWLDGWLYATAIDRTTQLSQSNAKNATVLLRYSPDGTEITKVADLHTDQQEENMEYDSGVTMIAHRGQLWIDCGYVHYYHTEDNALEINYSETVGGFEMLVYQPENGNVTKLYGTDEPVKGLSHSGCFDYKGIGDYIYFRKEADWHNSAFSGAGIFRLDCRTGLTEQLVKINASSRIEQYTVIDGKIVYWQRKENSYVPSEVILHQYDIETGEDTALMSAEELVLTQYPDYTRDSQVVPNIASLVSTGDHILVFWGMLEDWEKGTWTYYLDILDKDSKKVRTIPYGQPLKLTDEGLIERITARYKSDGLSDEELEDTLEDTPSMRDVSYLDGVLYIGGYRMMYTAQLSDVLEGKLDLKPIYIINDYK